MASYENILNDTMEFPVEIFIQDSDTRAIEVKEHWHNCLEFLYYLKGSGLHTINDREYIVKEKQLVVLRSGDIHSIYCDSSIHTRIFVLKFEPSMIHPKYKDSYQSRYLSTFLMQKDSVPELNENQRKQLGRLFQKMEQEMEEKKLGFDYMIRGYILEFLGYLTRQHVVESIMENCTEKQNADVIRIARYIEEHYFEELGLEQIAETLHLDYYYTSRYFKKITGKNFKQFLDFVRISEVNRHLIEGDKSITQIALECGFQSPQSLNRTYNRITGRNPSEVRKRR